MNITPEDIYRILEEEVKMYLGEIDLTDDQLDVLLKKGMGKTREPEEHDMSKEEIFGILGQDGIEDLMIALANVIGDDDLVKYTKSMKKVKR